MAHVASWPFSTLSRTLTFFSRILGIGTPISNPFWITNRDSLMHDEDYTTLKNGWEIISKNDDEVNSMNENEK